MYCSLDVLMFEKIKTIVAQIKKDSPKPLQQFFVLQIKHCFTNESLFLKIRN
jgi:hypothetical protein